MACVEIESQSIEEDQDSYYIEVVSVLNYS